MRGILNGLEWGPIIVSKEQEGGVWRQWGEGEGGTARVWAFREEERMADMAVANDAGSLDCFLRSVN